MRFFLISAFALACLVLPQYAEGQIQPSVFHIAIIDGEGALNNVKGRIAREPIIQVEDQNHKPVVGAYVFFDSPSSGAGGLFADGTTHFATTTDAFGRAVAHGLRPNNVSGKFEIHVHVTYQGQPVGEAAIHQVNVSGEVAHLSKNLENSAVAATVAAGVLGLVVGREFVVDGSSIPGNANLTNGARLQTLSTTVTLYLHDQCEFLVAPHSTVTVSPSRLALRTGTLRARRFGTCKVSYGAMLLVGVQPTADAVVATGATGLQVASLDGTVQVLTADGSIIDTVTPGVVSDFGTVSNASSGASAATGAGKRVLYPIYPYLLLGTSLAGLGIAIDTISQGNPSPTSP